MLDSLDDSSIIIQVDDIKHVIIPELYELFSTHLLLGEF